MSPRTPATSGFTLIEMLVTLAIAALIAGLAFPGIERAIKNVAFTQSSSRLILIVRNTSAQAVREGRRVDLQIVDGTLRQQPDGHPEPLAPTITVMMQPGTIAFFPDGTTTGGTIGLRMGDRRFAVRIDSATGSIVTKQR